MTNSTSRCFALLLVLPAPRLVGFIPVLVVSLTIVLSKISSNRLLTRGVDGSDVEQLSRRARSVVPELMHERLIRHPCYEGTDHIGVLHVREVVTLLGEVADVLAESLSCLLPAVP